MHPTGLAARELGDVGVLLLREHRRAGRVRVGKLDEPELLGRPEHDLLADAREVRLRERRDEQRLGDEVAVGHRVERVLERTRETELGCDVGRVERQARSRQRAGAERRHRRAIERVAPTVDVAAERPEVREEMVREHHRLRALHVRVARAGRCRPRLRPGARSTSCSAVMRSTCSRPARRRNSRRSSATWSLRLRPVCSLAPAGPARSVTRRSIAVWMSSSVGSEHELARLELGLDPVERGDDQRAFVLVEQPDARRACATCAREPSEVVGREADVERQADGEREQLVGRAPRAKRPCQSVRPPPAVRRVVGRHRARSPAPGPWRRDHVSTERPQSRTKPAESSCRNESSAS